MIKFAFKKPQVTGPHGPVTGARDVQGNAIEWWAVRHPDNHDAYLAYCSTRFEAEAVAREIETTFSVIEATTIKAVTPIKEVP